jgi:hypothetical protein
MRSLLPDAPRRLRHGLTAAALAAVSFTAAGAAQAAAPAPGGISMAPLTPNHTMVFAARPGETVRARVRLTNTSGRDRSVVLRATDLATAAGGGMDFPDRAPHAGGSLLRLGAPIVRVPAHGRRDVAVTARLPRAARHGDLYAGLTAVDASAHAATARTPGVSLRRVVRLALPVAFRLPGSRTHRLTIAGGAFAVDALGTHVDLRLHGAGNAKVERTAVDLRLERDGHTLVTHRGSLAAVYPGTTFAYRIPWLTQRPVRGTYHVVGTLHPEGGPAVPFDLPVTFGRREAAALKSQTTVVAADGGSGNGSWLVLAAEAGLMAGLGFGGGFVVLRWRERRRR